MLGTSISTSECGTKADKEPAHGSLVVFADDWGRHPSSCQHLVKRLLDRYEVLWVNTIGMRAPNLNFSTITRALEKFRQWSKTPRAEPTHVQNPRVVNPRMWPWTGTSFGRWANRRLLSRQLEPLVSAMQTVPTVVTTIPIVVDLINVLPARRWVYYCVDDFTQWPGLDHLTIDRFERALVQKVDAAISVSKTLQDRMRSLGRDSEIITHGIDLNFWQRPSPSDATWPDLSGPLVIFWGVLDRRMDVSFLQALAEKMTCGSIVLAGPESDPDPALKNIPRVRLLGSIPFEKLPDLAQRANVLVMPYADLPVTRAIQPLKLKEYLATGKATVVRDLPATREWKDCLDLAATPAQFADLVCERLTSGPLDTQIAARSQLVQESWQAKADRFEQICFQIQ